LGIGDFLLFVAPIIFLELLAAIAGSYYLKTVKSPIKNTNLLVMFLWFTVFVEIFGSYSPIGYFSEYRYFPFIQDTVFQNNLWWYNLFAISNFAFFTYYFISFLKNKTLRSIAHVSIVLYLFISLGVYIITGSLFSSTSNFVMIIGTLLLLMSVLSFYFELLRSDLLLQLKRLLPFYISVGVLIFNLCVTPVDILSDYFSATHGNALFVKLHITVLLFANLFLYTIFILGFLICSRTRKFSY
jgi:hypothetical protein